MKILYLKHLTRSYLTRINLLKCSEFFYLISFVLPAVSFEGTTGLGASLFFLGLLNVFMVFAYFLKTITDLLVSTLLPSDMWLAFFSWFGNIALFICYWFMYRGNLNRSMCYGLAAVFLMLLYCIRPVYLVGADFKEGLVDLSLGYYSWLLSGIFACLAILAGFYEKKSEALYSDKANIYID
jgi:hypothetical protein